jgi:hypothetical protein
MMYTVFMTNFGMNKGSFPTLDQAVQHAKLLGFECAIFKDGELIRVVKPY